MMTFMIATTVTAFIYLFVLLELVAIYMATTFAENQIAHNSEGVSVFYDGYSSNSCFMSQML